MQKKTVFSANVIISKKTSKWLSFLKKRGGGDSRCVQGKVVSTICNSKMENVSKSVNITKSDHVKAEVILEQGQCRHGVHTCLDTKGRYTDSVVTKNCHSSKSISREG